MAKVIVVGPIPATLVGAGDAREQLLISLQRIGK